MAIGSAFDRLREQELLVDVLLRLDFRSVARMRVVCCSWYRILSSRSFLDRHGKQQHHGIPWVVRTILSRGAQSAVLWRPFSGRPLEPTSLPLGPPGVPSTMFASHVTANGLVCGTLAGWPETKWPRSRSLAVGNPLTNSWKVLQCPEKVFLIEAMDVDLETGIYRIAVLNIIDEEDVAYILQYNSGSGSWALGGSTTAGDLYNPGYNQNEAKEDGNPRQEGDKDGIRRAALSVLEKDEELGKWLTLSHTFIREILGGEWPLDDIDIHGEQWMAHLAGDVIVVSSRMYPLLAFHLVEKKWEYCGHSDEELVFFASLNYGRSEFPDIRAYTFAPSFARP
ncbi:hypothetical protein SELMODRAFT_408662 [Selaginella moellendorffii]|uniref:F-box domain-containing protein n=1 Tax=Selaginella moellendorffii TaxID=88036 RepID=D8R9J1_SELML|nr:hypothetical protein SELMODRAFT_408662 [Selaginella moellendorffii]